MFTRTETGKEICECGHVRKLHSKDLWCVGIVFNGHVDNRENCLCYGFKNETGKGSIKGLLPEPMASEQLYEVREMEINKSLKKIKSLLKEHKNRFLNDSKNYGYAGDLGSILEYLRNITEQF
jgi:hypothetical protein